MAAADTTGKDPGAAPVACTLTSEDLATQADRWHQLAARAMTGRTETADGLRISFRAEPGAEKELRNLVAVEVDCCRWANWAMETSRDQLILDVRSTGAGIATLHTMFTNLQPATTPRD